MEKLRQVIIGFVFCIWLCLYFTLSIFGQTEFNEEDQKIESIIIENADNQVFENINDTITQFLSGNVRAYHKGAFIFCENAILRNNELIAYHRVVIIQSDTIVIFADSLKYLGKISRAYLLGNVALKSGKNTLFTKELEYHTDTKKAYYFDKALLANENSNLKSKSGVYDVENKFCDFYENVSIEKEDFYLKTDSLRYYLEDEFAVWNTPALIRNKDALIYAENGFYDLDDKFAQFAGNAQFKEDGRISKAQIIRYDGKTNEILLIGEALYVNNQEIVCGDTIAYNQNTKFSQIIGNAYYENEKSQASGEKIIYDEDKESFDIKGGGVIKDSTITLSALSMDYSRKNKVGVFEGNVVVIDTSSNTTLRCDYLNYDGANEYFKASNQAGKPVLEIVVNGENLAISADTLISLKKFIQKDSTTMDTVKHIIADNSVKIYRSNFQASCDSLVFCDQDSSFTLMELPILWFDSTQMIGDTIKLFLKNKKLYKMIIPSNPLIISSKDEEFFNQMTGRQMEAYFKDGDISNLRMDQNANVVYYLMDEEDAYIAVNTTTSTYFVIYFENKKVQEINFYRETNSEVLPMEKTNHEQLKLSGFRWLLDQKPKKQDVLNKYFESETKPVFNSEFNNEDFEGEK